jgi:hypothetical protein
MTAFCTRRNPVFPAMSDAPQLMSRDRFYQFFQNECGLPHQKDGIFRLYDRIAKADPTILREAEQWRTTFSTPPKPVVTNPLNVPYFWQQDNGAEGWRQCQSSCIAMGLAFKQVEGIRDDLDYVRIMRRFGDTIYRATHYKALSFMGFPDYEWRENWDEAQIKIEIRKGNVICAGIYHHGPVSNPSGGGHFINLIGFDEAARQWVVHDPYGELDLVNGGWAKRSQRSGRFVRYSYTALNPRLFHPGPKNGWAWVIR